MARTPKSPAVAAPRNPLEGRPHTTASARVREVWDQRLRVSERELLLELAGVRYAEPPKWSEIDLHARARILIALRDLMQLGNEAAYALGYSRRKG